MRSLRVSRFRCGLLRSSLRAAQLSTTTTHFGFRDVDVNEKEKLVGSVFHRVAKSYDLMNDLMSGSLHRAWKDEFVAMAGPLQVASRDSGTVILDVAGGTGDIAFRLFESLESGLIDPADNPRIIVCDINPSMLEVGRSRAESKGLLTGEFSRCCCVVFHPRLFCGV
jgi:ubiquinone/menaquinone biosynthesis C-methylase UbiE